MSYLKALWVLPFIGIVALPRPVFGEEPNPCKTNSTLRCPDLRMSAPYDLLKVKYGKRMLLRAANSINSRGAGPAELIGKRSSPFYMEADQIIYRKNGSRLRVDTPARLAFKNIPSQGRYWKFYHAAEFQIWSLNADGSRRRLIRKGPKVSYCLRDLKRTQASTSSPKQQVYPACSKDPARSKARLGTSVGWSDIYPYTYHEQWIDISGLRGRFAFVHIADPKNGIWESEEENNQGETIIRLPKLKVLSRTEGLPKYRWSRPIGEVNISYY